MQGAGEGESRRRGQTRKLQAEGTAGALCCGLIGTNSLPSARLPDGPAVPPPPPAAQAFFGRHSRRLRTQAHKRSNVSSARQWHQNQTFYLESNSRDRMRLT